MNRLKGLAVYGAIGVGVAGYGIFTEADRDSSGAIVAGGSLSSFEMRVGDCFDDADSLIDGEEISSIPAVPCSESHDNEVYAVFDISDDDFPGHEAVFEIASDGCLERFDRYVGRDYESSGLDFFAMYPTRESWNRLQDREVVCAVYDLDLEKLEGSIKGLGL